MLKSIGQLIEKRPWLVITIVLLITIGFGSLLPALEMQTSMDNFLPDDEVVTANNRINNYFGAGDKILMVLIQNQKSSSVTSPEALREMSYVSDELLKIEDINGIVSVAGFTDSVCFMEFGKSLKNCTHEQIKLAYQDLMSDIPNSKISILEYSDPNEPVDYNVFPRISKGKANDCIDIKDYYIEESGDNISFIIEVYDLSNFGKNFKPPSLKMNVMEWYIDFKNTVIPNEELDMEYKIAAHVEPKHEIWEIGRGLQTNLKLLFSHLQSKELFNTYSKDALLWISPPDQSMSFPIKLETGIVEYDEENNFVNITVEKKELGNYGISPQFGSFGLPARIENSAAGFRYYQVPLLKLPWFRFDINGEFLKDIFGKIQNRPLIKTVAEKLLGVFGGFSFEDINEMFDMMDQGSFALDTISVKDISGWWTVTDSAPDKGKGTGSYFIKPTFLDDMKKTVQNFVANQEGQDAYAALMMVQIDGSIGSEQYNELSNEIDEELKKLDSKNDYVSMKVTGNGIIEYEINEVSMEANNIVIPMIFVVISLILFVSFRRLSYVIIPLLGLSVAVIWLFGTMVLLGFEFMIIEVALIPMLMGLGVDYSVHIFHNYRVERSKGENPAKAIVSSINDIGLAMLLATITTFIAFLSFLTVSMVPLRNFGILCGIGIAYVFIITITLQATIRYLLDRRKKAVEKSVLKKDPNGKIMKKTATIVCKHPFTILAITLVITGIMVIGALQIQTGFNMDDFLPEENPSVQVMNEILDTFPFASQEKEYILLEGKIDTVKSLNQIDNTINNIDDDAYVLRTRDGKPKTESILSVIQKTASLNSSFKQKFNLDYRGIPKNDDDVKALYEYLYSDENTKYETQQFLHKTSNSYDATVIIVYSNVASTETEDINKVIKQLYDELNEDIASFDGVNAVVTGENSMMHVIMESMTESQVLSTAICIVLAAVVLIVAYRKPLLGLISMIPVCVSTVWIIGTMYYMGYTLNVMTIMITSLTIGLGITYAIHAVERFRLIADRTGDVVSAVSETVGHTGGALLIAALTTMFGFGLLILTPMPVEQQFGLITALTILYAFLTSIFILPPVLMFWGRWKKKTKGYVITPNDPNKKN
jgi:hydrophobe/amphiphile efflux-3 (HAE3) family protein